MSDPGTPPPGTSVMVEKIRTGETDPFEVVQVVPDGTLTVTNFDDGTVTTTAPDGETTVEVIPNAGD